MLTVINRFRLSLSTWIPHNILLAYEFLPMAAESDLISIAQEMAKLEGSFVRSRSSGLYLKTDDAAMFKRLAVEAKSIIDAELRHANDFSMNLLSAISRGSGGFFGGPSLACVKEAIQLVEGAVNHIRRRPDFRNSAIVSTSPPYVDTSRLAELRSLRKQQWDVTRLIRLCEELNSAHNNGCLMSVTMLVRAIVDHVPPIFECKSFTEVANNVTGAKSFKGSMEHLNQSLRNVADAYLHLQIRPRESLPAPSQVEFSADLDVLLAEVVRLLK
jgi:hypothetical protein